MSTAHSRHADRASSAKHRLARLLPLLVILLFPLSACSFDSPPKSKVTPTVNDGPAVPTYDFPAVAANYVYDQLYYLSSTFQQRESGFDVLSEHNGHQAFARYWAQEMQQNLRGFAPAVTSDTFQGGWISRPAASPSYNVEVTVAGAIHPEQVVIVGCHYDGMHVSLGSAFDDTSGCAILLGEARALGDYWRAHHLVPMRTLRFVLFDAEEQGLLGSYQYVNSTINGDTANIVAMLNEEQSGFSYPVRFLGLASNPVIPLHIRNTYNGTTFFSDLLQTALTAVSAEMRTMGFMSVTYRGDHGQNVSLPVFAADQRSPVLVTGDSLGGSDDAGFDEANVPALTFIAGDEGISDPQTGRSQTPNIPSNEAYPFDTHDDTIQLMNGYASGATAKSQALVLALGFQTMLGAWMLSQSALAGNVTADQVSTGPIATIGDIGVLQPGLALTAVAQSAYDPRDPQSQPSYHWTFGDGTQADGAQVQHTYASSGTYTLTLAVQDTHGTRRISERLSVAASPPTYANVFLPLLQRERDTGNPLAQGDHQPPPGYQMPAITQNGDGLTSADQFPGHNG